MRAAIAILSALALPACGDSEPCEPPSGAVAVQWTERTGNCTGDFEGVLAFGGEVGDGLSPGCTGTRRVDRDACLITFDMTCVVDGEATSTRGELAYDASSVTGLLEVQFQDGCRSTYDIEGDR